MDKLRTLDELIRDGCYPDDAREKSIRDLIKVVNEMLTNIKYEYSDLIEGKTFNDMGAEGWEYVGTRHSNIDVFKRKII